MISVVPDKSVFQRLAEQTPENQAKAWDHLHGQCQVVVPAILIEEVIVNMADPGPLSKVVIQEMWNSLHRIPSCWMDDVFEIAFRELVERQPTTTLPAFPSEYLAQIRGLAPNHPELLKWVRERRTNREITVNDRMMAQDELIPREERRVMADESEFWIRLRNQFVKILRDPERRIELLEVVLGETFRFRHPDSIPKVNAAFVRFTHETFTQYYVSAAILIVRLAYMYAPLVKFENRPGSVRRFVGRGVSNQRNNPGDEQYIVAAMICNRLLTRDADMKNIIDMFGQNGFTKCQGMYLDPSGSIVDQILQMKV